MNEGIVVQFDCERANFVTGKILGAVDDHRTDLHTIHCLVGRFRFDGKDHGDFIVAQCNADINFVEFRLANGGNALPNVAPQAKHLRPVKWSSSLQ